MAKVSAPYNFVPLNEKVFFPPWANLVNHDVPFKDGLSGQIELEITAETPIFIRKPYEQTDEKGIYYTNEKGVKISKEFCHIKDENGGKHYYIPGSSIRNMLRSVVEIMGFGKLSIEKFTNRRYGVRDFNNTDVYTLLDETENIRIGYLATDKVGNYFIYDKGIPKKVSQSEIYYTERDEKLCLKDLFDSNKDSKAITINRNGNKVLKAIAKTAKYKYNETKTNFDSKKGGYVFTGQPSFNNFTKGKQNEFIIEKLDKKKDSKIVVTIEQYDDFKFIYGDYAGSSNISKDWEMWKKKLNNNQAIPIFFRLNDNNVLEDFGLTFLYKMAYRNRIEKAISNIQRDYNSDNYDLADLIFGTISDAKTNLKGRVQINHAFSLNAKANNEYKIVLASPKASYYPFYIEQNINEESTTYKIKGKYNTYNNSFVKIRGRKRYPLHELNIPTKQEQNKFPNNIATFIKPINKDTTFNTKIIFHNLLPEELGALLSAITFHNNVNCRHSIGAAKPFGLGQISINISKIDLLFNNKVTNNEKSDIEDIKIHYMSLFEKEISKKIENWSTSIQIKEFFTMSSIIAKEKFVDYDYMKLFDFPKIKNEDKALPRYSRKIDYEEPLNPLIKNIKLNLTDKEELSYLLARINNKINNIQYKKYNDDDEYILKEGDYVGTVKFFNNDKGFGFIIENKTQTEYFVHKNNLFDNVTIKEGDLVIFNIKEGRKGKEADAVELFNNLPTSYFE